jgi:hypothetical protein
MVPAGLVCANCATPLDEQATYSGRIPKATETRGDITRAALRAAVIFIATLVIFTLVRMAMRFLLHR